MNLTALANLRARGVRPRDEIWCVLGCPPRHDTDVPLTGSESIADLAPLMRLRVVLEHEGQTPAEIWPLAQRLIEVKVGVLVVTDRASGRTGMLVHPTLGPTCMTRIPQAKQAWEAQPTWS